MVEIERVATHGEFARSGDIENENSFPVDKKEQRKIYMKEYREKNKEKLYQ
jgi:hypothetical protein